MRIAITSDIYYPMINGVAMFARNLAGGLQKRGHEVIVLAPSLTGKSSVEVDEEDGFRVFRLSSFRMALYPDQIEKVPARKKIGNKELPRLFYKNGLHVSLNAYSEVREILQDFQPDIIHDQTPGPVAIAVFRYAKKYHVPIVATDHAYPDNLTQQLKLPKSFKRPLNRTMNHYFTSFLRRSDYATMPTERAIADLAPKHSKVPVEALSNGIDLSRFQPKPAKAAIYEKYHLPKNQPCVLYVGRVDPEKSLEVLLRAFVALAKKLQRAHLIIVGDGTARPALEEMARVANLTQRVHFLGRVVGADLPELYRVASVFAISSKTETQSIVLMEAMASGLPCVAVAAGALPELIQDNENGFLCPPDDVDAMSNALTKILSDKEMAQKMSEQSLKKVKKHDIRHTLARIEEIYETVLAKRAEQE